MATVVAIVGASDSGKTTLVTELVPALGHRGLKVGTLKHASHGFKLDNPGSDSARHLSSGALPVMLVGPDRQVLFGPRTGESLASLAARYFDEVDLVLAEGFSAEPVPKVVVHRSGLSPRVIPEGSRDEVLFAITDEPLGYPVELGPGELERAADLLATHARAGHSGGTPKVSLNIDGIAVPLSDFVASFLTSTVSGMVGALKGIPQSPTRIELTIKQP